MDIKPIETEYNGYRFRSRLEARWAVFFDAIGAEWEYEQEGYILSDGTCYLPDFLLKNVRGRVRAGGPNKIFVEIKGVLTKNDLHKIEQFSGYNSEFGPDGYPVIIFGQIPDCTLIERHYVPYLNDYIGPWWQFDFDKDNNEHFYNLEYSEGDNYLTRPMAAKGGGLVLDYPDNPYDYVDEELTVKAYAAARQARFEHGQTPQIRR
jgi:hypothetical protein